MSDVSTAFEIIRSVAQTMLESHSSQPALEAVVRLISEKMQVDVCSIYLYREGRLRLTASHGLNQDKLGDVTMAPEEGLTGYVYRSGEVVNIADPSHDQRNKYFPSLGEDRLGNFLGIPIPPETGRGAGVLTLQATERRPFPSTVEDLAYTLAAQLGTMLENQSLKGLPGDGLAPEAPQRRECPPFVRAQVAFGGIAMGPVLVLKTHQIWETIYFAESPDPAEELETFRRAVELAREESRWLKQRAGQLFAEMDARIFEAHELLLADDGYVGVIEGHIRERMAAAFAVKLATRELCQALADSGNPSLASKGADIRDVGLRLLNALGEATGLHHPEGAGPAQEEGCIVAAAELLPSDLIYLQARKLIGIVCEGGGVTSHAAILARSLGIPCFMGVTGLTGFVQNGMRVIMDGNSGLLFLRPDDHVKREYRRLSQELERARPAGPPTESVTADGVPVRLSGNLSLLSDLELMEQHGVQGVGLYRTEFLFMIRSQFPDEEAQFEVYRKVVERCHPHDATIRVLDVGGDKPLRYFDWGKEENPYLGWRSIRMLLERKDIFMPHLRALVRTAQAGKMRVVLPMISLVTEVRAARALMEEARAELEAETGRPHRLPPLGAMIEIPAAVLQIRPILAEVDFLCIGTNDLIQYLFAVDRGNERVAAYYQPYHPALLNALRQIAEAARTAGKDVCVCGEMAADTEALPILLGLGMTQLSVSPASAAPVREALRRLRTDECRELMDGLMDCATAEQVREAIGAFWKSQGQAVTA